MIQSLLHYQTVQSSVSFIFISYTFHSQLFQTLTKNAAQYLNSKIRWGIVPLYVLQKVYFSLFVTFILFNVTFVPVILCI